MFTVAYINTVPEPDPYTNPHLPSKTTLYIDPARKIVYVDQEYRDNATPAGIWHSRILSLFIPGHPHEDDVAEWIESYKPTINAAINGHTIVWNGHDYVGKLTEDARTELDTLESATDEFNLYSYYEFWSLHEWTESWYQQIEPDWTDEDLAAWTDTDPHIVLDGDLMEYIIGIRDSLREEQEQEQE